MMNRYSQWLDYIGDLYKSAAPVYSGAEHKMGILGTDEAVFKWERPKCTSPPCFTDLDDLTKCLAKLQTDVSGIVLEAILAAADARTRDGGKDKFEYILGAEAQMLARRDDPGATTE